MGTKISCWQERLATFDFEVTEHDWFISTKIKNTGERFEFHNDPTGLEDFLNEYDHLILVGYNNKHYDNYILKGILNHYVPTDIKIINDWIIIQKKPGWEYPFDMPFVTIPPTCDLMLDMPLKQSLKELEGNMCMDIQESTVDFNIDHPWTKEEFEEMKFYCRHDVDATEHLIDERMDYLESKVSLGEMCGLTVEESLYRTNAQLAAKSLGAEKVERDDYRDYVIPPEVDRSLIPQSILDFIEKFKSVKKDDLNEDNVKLSWVGDIVGTEHKIGLGGIHAAKKNYFEESNDKRIIVDFDVNSYYPSLLIEYDYLSRNVADKQKYVDYYHDRIAAKKAGDKRKANGLKLVLNTTYGASLNKYNDLYDPLMGVSTCLTGQLLLTQLLVTLERDLNTFVHIQSNTDGIMFSVDRDELNHAREIINEWSDHTRLGMGEIQIKRVIQKDVNNYLIENFDGEIEVRGAYVSDYPNGSFKHNSFSIVAEAIVRYFTENKPVEETIMACKDPFRFQLIAKTGSTYDHTVHYVDGEEIKVQKVNRLYAVTDERYGVVKKVKKQHLELDEDGERRYYINQKGNRTYKKKWETDDGGDFFIKKDTTQNCPEHAIIDNSCQITIDTIDTKWYIELAKKRINDFLGIKEEKKMAKKKTEETSTLMLDEPKLTAIKVNEDGTVCIDENAAKILLYKKIQKVGEWLRAQAWVADGYNSAQSYEYVKSHKYREMLGKACASVGLLFKPSITNRGFEKLEATKNMNLTTLFAVFSFIDPETGAHEDYPVMGDGSDNLDKGIYKAETMMIKYFVLNNFLLPQQQDEMDPEDGADEKKVAKEENKPVKIVTEEAKKATPPATPKQREEAKQEVVSDNNASVEYIRSMIAAINKIQKVQPGYGQKTLDNLFKVIEGSITLSKKDAIAKMVKIENKMDELGIE